MKRYEQSAVKPSGHGLGVLADAVEASADRACKAIDDSLEFVAQSNARIAKMELAARFRRSDGWRPAGSWQLVSVNLTGASQRTSRAPFCLHAPAGAPAPRFLPAALNQLE